MAELIMFSRKISSLTTRPGSRENHQWCCDLELITIAMRMKWLSMSTEMAISRVSEGTRQHRLK